MKAEKFIMDYTRTCSNELSSFNNEIEGEVHLYHPWLTPDQALSAVAIEKEEVIEKACQYLREHRLEVETEDNGIAGWIPDVFIENLKKYMEEQV